MQHPDREISTGLIASMSKLLPMRLLQTYSGAHKVAEGLVEIAELLPPEELGTNPIMMAKAQGGLPSDLEAEFEYTAQNPVLLDSIGTILIMYNVPSLPQMPASPELLRELWPRMQTYAIRDKSDPLYSLCSSGATGNVTAAADCMSTWHARIPELQAKLAKVRDILWRILPNIDSDRNPLSGSYWYFFFFSFFLLLHSLSCFLQLHRLYMMLLTL